MTSEVDDQVTSPAASTDTDGQRPASEEIKDPKMKELHDEAAAARIEKKKAEKYAAELAEKLKGYTDAEAKAAEEKAKATGEFDALLNENKNTIAALTTERETLQTQLSAYEAAVDAQIEAMLKDVPAEKKALVDAEKPLDKLKQIQKFQAAGVFTAQQHASDLGAGVRTGAGGKMEVTRESVLGNRRRKL